MAHSFVNTNWFLQCENPSETLFNSSKSILYSFIATQLTTRCLCSNTKLWTRLYHGTSANASTVVSMHRHYARRLRHCSSKRSLAPTTPKRSFLRCTSYLNTGFSRSAIWC